MSFIHVEESGKGLTLVLLHGTGGTERDLMQIGRDLAPESSLLGVRGKVSEHGMSRWFKRFQEGVFDEEDIRRQAADLAQFLREKKSGPMIGLGYSNGANIGAALMLLHPNVLDGLIMWRGMLPLTPVQQPDLLGKRILMTNGTLDSMGPIESARKLEGIFHAAGANVEKYEFLCGHGLTQSDFLHTQEWLRSSNQK